LIAVAIRTAPKTCGEDNIVTCVASESQKERIAEMMEKKGRSKGKTNPLEIHYYQRDANNLRRSQAILLVGVKGTIPKSLNNPLNCGACGYFSCNDFMKAEKKMGEDYIGPLCIFQVIDLGVALGSAVKMAAELCVDNRLMNSVGTAAMKLGLLDADLIIGIPLSATGKNIYFDRK
jgi:uncharacterized ferredoxin-like protein